MKKLVLLTFSLSIVVFTYGSSAIAASTNPLASAIALKSGGTEQQAREQIKMVFSVVRAELSEGREVTVRNFGRFYVQQRNARKGRNPSTGASIDIPAKKYPRFSSSKRLKKEINDN